MMLLAAPVLAALVGCGRTPAAPRAPLRASPDSLTLTAPAFTTGFTLAATGADAPWEVTAAPPWAQVTPTRGTAMLAPQDVRVYLRAGWSSLESDTGRVVVHTANGDLVVPVTLASREGDPVTTTAPFVTIEYGDSTSSFTLQNRTSTSRGWTLQSRHGLVHLDPREGVLAPLASVRIGVHRAVSLAQAGVYDDTLSLSSTGLDPLPGGESREIGRAHV